MGEIKQNSIRNKKVCHLKDDSKTSTRAVRQRTHLLSELCSTCFMFNDILPPDLIHRKKRLLDIKVTFCISLIWGYSYYHPYSFVFQQSQLSYFFRGQSKYWRHSFLFATRGTTLYHHPKAITNSFKC